MTLPKHTQTDPWRFALESLREGQRTVLVFVVDHSGSVPGVTGTRVVVSDSGFAGTIGGGAAEMQLIERAVGHRGDPKIYQFRHTPSGGGTLCSGVQNFAIISLSPNDEDAVHSIVETLGHHRTGVLRLTPDGVEFNPGETRPHSFSNRDGSWEYVGPIGLEDTLYIIGGGHVALALSKVMATLPFRIIVLDNRADLPTMEANRWAHEQQVVSFDEIGAHIDPGDRTWAVIMTFGHAHDRQVLEGLLGREFAYLGLMGSKAKVRQMYAAMVADGIPEASLVGVRAPVGMSIGSHTPEEIAISIAAEIISLRNRG
ncbi:MAG: XdhC family protein [Acidobacteriota bacterium]|jgi:xanthine dehydrogenase accessory factor|nr:XdhC family protein [Acidobacteriota bacterium]